MFKYGSSKKLGYRGQEIFFSHQLEDKYQGKTSLVNNWMIKMNYRMKKKKMDSP